MASKKKSRTHGSAAEQAGEAMRASAQKIWLAGLGAFERAKSEGPKVFEALVAQGRDLGAKARESADQALRSMRATSHDASGRWDKLEQVFEDRVSKSLNRLGVVTGREVESLSRQVADLNETVRNLMRADSGPRKASSTRPKGGAKRKAASKAGGTARKSKSRAKARPKAAASRE